MTPAGPEPLEPRSAARREEPTLAQLLTRVARDGVPGRLYQLLNLAFPVAVDFAARGWWRPAALALSIAAFGAWGIADRWLCERAGCRAGSWRTRWVLVARTVAGALSATTALLLVLETFLRMLGAAPGH